MFLVLFVHSVAFVSAFLCVFAVLLSVLLVPFVFVVCVFFVWCMFACFPSRALFPACFCFFCYCVVDVVLWCGVAVFCCGFTGVLCFSSCLAWS